MSDAHDASMIRREFSLAEGIHSRAQLAITLTVQCTAYEKGAFGDYG
jgi:hypothetical protein